MDIGLCSPRYSRCYLPCSLCSGQWLTVVEFCFLISYPRYFLVRVLHIFLKNPTFKIFLMWVILKFCWICYNIASVWFFGHGTCGILASQPGTKPVPAGLEGDVLTTGPPLKSPQNPNFLYSPWSLSGDNCSSPQHSLCAVAEFVRVGILSLLHFLKESKTNNLSNGVLDSESYQVLKNSYCSL